MTTSTPPAWHRWLSECSVPVTSDALSTDQRILPGPAPPSEHNDSPDPTYQGCRPSERYPSDGPDDSTPESAWAYMASRVGVPERAVSTTASGTLGADQCDECRAAPGCDVSSSPDISCDRKDDATVCDETAKVTDSVINAAPSHRIGTCYLDPDTGETVMPGDFFGEKELRWKPDKDGNRHDGEPLVTVAESCSECGTVTDIEYVDEGFSVPVHVQALWLARHIEDLHSPRPDVVSDDELRGMTLIRVLGIGADEHGDEVFRKDSPELRKDRSEEWSDGEFYDLVDRFGHELTFPAKVASSLKSSGPAE